MDVKRDIQSALENSADYYDRIMNQGDHLLNKDLCDIHNGNEYEEFVECLPADRKKSFATVTFNSDGSPVFKSSKFSIWPIQIILNEVPVHVRHANSIIYALWFGHEKPNMTFFLNEFVKDINLFKRIYVYALCCCVDSGARPTMQGMVHAILVVGGAYILVKLFFTIEDMLSSIPY